jgi:hypothetical protein
LFHRRRVCVDEELSVLEKPIQTACIDGVLSCVPPKVGGGQVPEPSSFSVTGHGVQELLVEALRGLRCDLEGLTFSRCGVLPEPFAETLVKEAIQGSAVIVDAAAEVEACLVV